MYYEIDQFRLEECPFCCGEGRMHAPLLGGWYVKCMLCRAQTDVMATSEGAMKRWNMRKQMQRLYRGVRVPFRNYREAENRRKRREQRCRRLARASASSVARCSDPSPEQPPPR